MKTVTKSLIHILCFVLLVLSFGTGVNASEEVASGTCGESATWTLTDDSVLKISGTGAISDFSWESKCPWDEYTANIVQVVINEGITHVGNNAFSDCNNLASVQLPEGLVSIGMSSFSHTALTSVKMPDSLRKIDRSAFSTCKLTDVKLNDGLETIGDGAFKYNPFTDFVIPDSVTVVKEAVFDGCNNLRNIHLSKNMYMLCYELFARCTSLTDIEIPSGIVRLGTDYSRYFATSIHVSEPNAADTVHGVFYQCSNLQRVSIPKTVAQIDSAQFEDCVGLQTVYYEGSSSEWKQISIGERNDPLLKANIIYNSSGTIVSPESVTLSFEHMGLAVDEQIRLSANVKPAEANQAVSWSSSNEEIATVDSKGIVTGKNLGEAIITATASNGLTATCRILVLFKDVADSKQYFYEPVYWAFENGITVGAGGHGKFSPNASCTREQFVTFLWRQQGKPSYEKSCDFSDVPTDAWYYEPISWAAEKGITTGLNDGTNRFGVGQACTREQCVTFLHRAAGSPEPEGSIEFIDSLEGRYYYNAIKWAAGKGITVGLNDGTGRFGVGQKCTRGMLVTFLYRFDQKN